MGAVKAKLNTIIFLLILLVIETCITKITYVNDGKNDVRIRLDSDTNMEAPNR